MFNGAVVGRSKEKFAMNLNGVSHVMLTVGQYDRAREFYSRLMPALGLECAYAGSDMCLFVGGRKGIGIQPCGAGHAGERSAPGGVGLHYLISSRSRSRRRGEGRRARQGGRSFHRQPCTGGVLGARLLLRSLRGPRRHPDRGDSRAGARHPRRRRELCSRRRLRLGLTGAEGGVPRIMAAVKPRCARKVMADRLRSLPDIHRELGGRP